VKHIYRAYGLTLESDSAVPGLTPLVASALKPDLSLDLHPASAWAQASLQLPVTSHRIRPTNVTPDEPGFTVSEHGDGKYIRLGYADGTQFVMDEAATLLWGKAGPGLSYEDVCVYLLGPVMGFVLRRRGKIPLHASALSIQGRGIAIVGEAGSGKSTTAAAMALRGWPVLSEDVCALEEEQAGFRVEPGYPRICLWPDSVEFLFSSAEALPLIVKGWEKRFLAADGAKAKFASHAVPLAAIFLLGDRSNDARSPFVETISQKETVLRLVQNTHMNWLLDKTQRAAEFDLLSRLASTVKCLRVVPSADPSRLRALAEMIESHTMSLEIPVLQTAANVVPRNV
jgi:hypothetical protein